MKDLIPFKGKKKSIPARKNIMDQPYLIISCKASKYTPLKALTTFVIPEMYQKCIINR